MGRMKNLFKNGDMVADDKGFKKWFMERGYLEKVHNRESGKVLESSATGC